MSIFGENTAAEPVELPTNIDYADFATALRTLGIPTKWLERISYYRGCLTVEYARFDGEGRIVAAGDQVATVTTVIGVDRPWRPGKPLADDAAVTS